MSGRELVPPTIPIPSDAAEGIPSDAIAPPAPKSADPRLPPAAVPPLPTLAPLTVRAGPAGPLAEGPLMSFQIWSIVFPLPLEVFCDGHDVGRIGRAAVAASAAAFAAFGPRRESWRESLCSYCDKIWSFMSVANSLTV